MGVITINRETTGLINDSRFRSWAKVLRTTNDVDLTKTNGYAITGPWAKWGESVAIGPNQYVVVACETGSRARHSYEYALLTIGPDDEPLIVPDEEIDAVQTMMGVSDSEVAKAKNSRLYAIALYCSRHLPRLRRPATDADVDAARAALAKLTDDQRAALFAEYDHIGRVRNG